MVELGEPLAHAVERARELAELVLRRVVERLVEAAAGDPVGRALQAADPAREDRGAAEAEDQRGEQGREAGDEQPVLDEMDAAERVVERAREEQDVPGVADRKRHLGVSLVAPRDGSVLGLERGRGLERHGIALDVGRRGALAGVVDGPERRLR